MMHNPGCFSSSKFEITHRVGRDSTTEVLPSGMTCSHVGGLSAFSIAAGRDVPYQYAASSQMPHRIPERRLCSHDPTKKLVRRVACPCLRIP